MKRENEVKVRAWNKIPGKNCALICNIHSFNEQKTAWYYTDVVHSESNVMLAHEYVSYHDCPVAELRIESAVVYKVHIHSKKYCTSALVYLFKVTVWESNWNHLVTVPD